MSFILPKFAMWVQLQIKSTLNHIIYIIDYLPNDFYKQKV